MTLSIDDQIERRKHSIAEMETQRETLGAELIDHALVPRDSDRARAAYQQSLDMFTEMGATGFVRVLEERLGRHE